MHWGCFGDASLILLFFVLGGQDWLTLVSFAQPELVYPLDCKFNRQLNQDYNQDPWKSIFWSYHQCHNKTTFDPDNTKIVHLNGGSTNFADYLIEKREFS